MAKKIERSALVMFSPAQMYALVNDINSYPLFMDGCVGAKVLSQTPAMIEATLALRKGKFSQSFTTRNFLTADASIRMTLLDGPFTQLDGEWLFKPIGDQGCKVQLTLTFEFKNKIVELTAGKWFEAMGNQLVDSVCSRAKQIYG